MIRKTDLVALARCVDHKVIVQVEQNRALVLVVDFATTIGLVLAYNLAAVFGNKLIFQALLLQINTPAGDF